MIYLAAIIALLLSLGGAGFYGFEQGKKVERADWMEKDAEQREAMGKELAEAMARVAKLNETNLTNTYRVINEKEAAIAQLERNLDDVSRLRISTKKPECPTYAVPGKTESASERVLSISEHGTGNVGTVLNEVQSDDNALNEQLRKVYINQEKLKIDLNKNIKLCEPLIEIVK